MKYEASIFDLDGTLLNTLEDLADAVNVALKENGMPPRTVEEVRQFVGNGIVKLIERAVPQGRENPAFDSTLQDFKKYYGQHCNDKTKPYPGILDTLNRLKERGVSMAIVSNKADFAVKELNPLYFEGVIDVALGENEEVGVRKKPAPDMVYKALEVLQCPIEKAVYIGDSDVDIKTAKNAGIPCISVTWGFRDRNFLLNSGAQNLADKPEEILKYL